MYLLTAPIVKNSILTKMLQKNIIKINAGSEYVMQSLIISNFQYQLVPIITESDDAILMMP